MGNLAVTYAQRPDAAPKAERGTLAAVYKFVLDSANKNAAGVTSTNGDDETKGSTNGLANTSVPR